METKRFTYQSDDGIEIHAAAFLPEDEPTAIVQIAHGMAEHKERYIPVAEAFTAAGFAVYINDHRGHGATAGSVEALGFFAERDGWQRAVDDMRKLTLIAKKEFPNLRCVLLGHSMGSFLARHFAMLYGNEIDGLILSGTAAGQGFLGLVGRALARLQMALKGARKPSRLLHSLAFDANNASFKPARTKVDWLSRDPETVDAYVKDPYCGTVFSSGFYLDLLKGIGIVNSKRYIRKIRKDLPILIYSGEKDPIGGMGKGVLRVAGDLIASGVKDVSVKLYKEGRHESHNEINRNEVLSDVISWIQRVRK